MSASEPFNAHEILSRLRGGSISTGINSSHLQSTSNSVTNRQSTNVPKSQGSASSVASNSPSINNSINVPVQINANPSSANSSKSLSNNNGHLQSAPNNSHFIDSNIKHQTTGSMASVHSVQSLASSTSFIENSVGPAFGINNRSSNSVGPTHLPSPGYSSPKQRREYLEIRTELEREIQRLQSELTQSKAENKNLQQENSDLKKLAVELKEKSDNTIAKLRSMWNSKTSFFVRDYIP